MPVFVSPCMKTCHLGRVHVRLNSASSARIACFGCSCPSRNSTKSSRFFQVSRTSSRCSASSRRFFVSGSGGKAAGLARMNASVCCSPLRYCNTAFKSWVALSCNCERLSFARGKGYAARSRGEKELKERINISVVIARRTRCTGFGSAPKRHHSLRSSVPWTMAEHLVVGNQQVDKILLPIESCNGSAFETRKAGTR